MTATQIDQAARDRIRTELGTNFLVEAGAGSGKTTALVGRMLEHIRTGTPVDQLVAVTFTRKAATELRERLQNQLERSARDAAVGGAEKTRYTRALRDLDRAFVGTIHAFCARLLRERPLEVSLDPAFQEVSDVDEWAELQRRFWRGWVAQMVRTDDSDLQALRTVGIDPRQLADGFMRVMQYPDVEFPTGNMARPDGGPCRRALERLVDEARRLMPTHEPPDGWDKLMYLVRRLQFLQSVQDWSDVSVLCDVLADISTSSCEIVQKRWSDTRDGKATAKALNEAFVAFCTGPVADLLHCWRAHRYPIVMRVLRRAAADFARERATTGLLGFEDLLRLAVRLVRDHPAVRDELGARYRYLFVDEFQDTDPIQAELCFLLASEAAAGSDWRVVDPRPGSLFVVGDPKQSIYRFRRADIQVYEYVKRRMAEFGAVVSLTSNFRSVTSIAAVVNHHFVTTFPATATPEQAPYSPMNAVHEPAPSDGVYRYVVAVDERAKDALLARDAAMVASWIADRIARGERTAGDFLILTARKEAIAWYARALSDRNVPVSTTGAKLPQEHELTELLIVLQAIADPENPVQVVAALEGLFFGLSPATFWEAAQLGIRFTITHRPAVETHPVGQALLQLYDWWMLSQRYSTDVLVERILEETGVLFHAVSQPLGDARAGALLHLVDALRTSSVHGANGIAEAMELLEVVLAAEAPDAPLRPGRSDAVRVMNLHKAKGLEADVVLLAAPVDESAKEAVVHISRAADGAASGGLCIGYQQGNKYTILAHPPHWRAMAAAEAAFMTAERERLLYVAATRAKRELVVAQAERVLKAGPKPDTSLWRPLAPTLEDHAVVLDLPERIPEGRRVADWSAAQLHDAVAMTRTRNGAAQTSSLVFRTVTEAAKAHPDPEWPDTMALHVPRAAGQGVAWGRAVHRSLDALGRGRRGATLHTFVRAVARDEALSAEETTALIALIDQFPSSDPWQRLVAMGTLQTELSIMHATVTDGVTTVTEGVMDATGLGSNGWQITDWKTDRISDADWARRQPQYDEQVGGYERMLAAVTGQPTAGALHRVR